MTKRISEFDNLIENFDFKDVRNNVKPLLSIFKKLHYIKDDFLKDVFLYVSIYVI